MAHWIDHPVNEQVEAMVSSLHYMFRRLHLVFAHAAVAKPSHLFVILSLLQWQRSSHNTIRM